MGVFLSADVAISFINRGITENWLIEVPVGLFATTPGLIAL